MIYNYLHALNIYEELNPLDSRFLLEYLFIDFYYY